MPSINYPFPDPRNDEERVANRRAQDEYQGSEEEAADFVDWQQELAGLPAPTWKPTAYPVSYHGAGMWTVTHGTGIYLDAEGESTDTHQDQAAPTAAHLFTLTDVLRPASEAAPTVAVNGIIAADVILCRKWADGR